jgi:hypothetical protein
MVSVEIDLGSVDDAKSFHAAFSSALGFSDHHGTNMNAWEDSMSDLSRPGVAGMTTVQVPDGEDLVLTLIGGDGFRQRQPDLFAALWESTASVNRSKVSMHGAPRILLLPL